MHHDIHKLNDKFHALTDAEQYQHLLGLFEQLDGKNKHCSYIYQKLQTTPDMFTSELMQSIYDESLQIYERTWQEKNDFASNSFAKCRDRIERIKQQEANDMIRDEEEILRNLRWL